MSHDIYFTMEQLKYVCVQNCFPSHVEDYFCSESIFWLG